MSLTSGALIALLLILLTGVFSALFTYMYANSAEKEIKNQSLKKRIINIEPRAILEAQEVQSDGVLPTSSAVIGVISLEVFARRHKPDYIVGVNRGGWLLSTYLAHRLNIGRNNLFRFDADKNEIIDNSISSNNTIIVNSETNILLVDDISRTGDSVSRSINYVKNKFSTCKISVAVMVICGRENDKNIDYSPYWTLYKDIQLPWSSDERKKEARRIIDAQGKVVQLGDQNSLDIKLPILRIADDETKEGEGVDISNDDIETVIGMLEKLFSIPEIISKNEI